jgi:hypothetical protein
MRIVLLLYDYDHGGSDNDNDKMNWTIICNKSGHG